MTCVVFGAGLVGSFLGAAAGAPWASRRRAGRIHERVVLPRGEINWDPFGEPAAETPVLIATRCHQTLWSAFSGCHLAAQNGLGQPCAVAVCFMAIDRDTAGRILSAGPEPRVVLGRLDQVWQPVITAWRSAGIIVEEIDDVRPAQWEKAILNATLGPICLATGLSMRAAWADTELRQLVLSATDEGHRVASLAAVAIPPGLRDRTIAFFDRTGSHRPSVLADPGEIPWTLGRLRDVARQHSLPVPALDRIERMAAQSLSGAA